MPKPCAHDSRELAAKLIGPLRIECRRLGYSLSVHGSLVRDIDLIACPWNPHAVEARELAEALRDVARGLNGGVAHHKGVEDSPWFHAGCPGGKPFGRLCWSYHLGGGPYIDLSVMPKAFAGDWFCPACQALNTSNPVCWDCDTPRG